MVIRRQRARRRAATLVEFAFVAVVFLMLLFGLFEYARLVMIRQVLDNAAREGARFAVVHTHDKTTADVIAQVQTYLAGQDAQLQNVQILVYRAHPTTGANIGLWTDAGFGQCIAVQITAQFRPILPAFLRMQDPFPLLARSMMYSEAN